MNITRFTDYSLRVLIFLSLYEKERVMIKSIAERYGISKNHLMKVVQELSAKGYVNSARGKNGGIWLNKPAHEINVGHLVRQIEQESVLVECFGNDNQCVITPSCQLKGMFAGAQESFFNHLEQFTIDDLVKKSDKNKLRSSLLIASAK